MKVTEFYSSIASIEDRPTGDYKNPFLTIIKFVFADNKANVNRMGIEAEEFEDIIKSSVNMPVKMRYTHADVQGHPASVPIGHITEMVKEETNDLPGDYTAKLVAEAVLYNEEYPEEVQFLKDSFNKGEAPGISWELAYRDSAQKNGAEWLKGVITRAATFVKHPAYGSRTALLAIASSNMDEKQVMDTVTTLVEGWNKAHTGGMNVDELEKAKADLVAAQAAATKAAEELTAEKEAKTALETELKTANEKIATLTEENETYKKGVLIAERTKKVQDAGLTLETDKDKLAAKQELWAQMSEDIFTAYVTDLASLKPAKSAIASDRRTISLPRLAPEGGETSFDDLRGALRRASRGDQSVE